MHLWRGAAALIIAVAATGCDATPIPSSPSLDASTATATATAEAQSLLPTASAGVANLPSLEPSLPPPPYEFTVDDIVQAPGTILFGDTHRGTFDTFEGWPSGITMDWDYTYGAYWGERVGDDQIRVTLYRVRNGTLSRVWTDVKAIEPEATGYLDSIVRFAAPGVYRIEVTRGVEPIAWSLIRVGAPCTEDCSGG